MAYYLHRLVHHPSIYQTIHKHTIHFRHPSRLAAQYSTLESMSFLDNSYRIAAPDNKESCGDILGVLGDAVIRDGPMLLGMTFGQVLQKGMTYITRSLMYVLVRRV